MSNTQLYIPKKCKVGLQIRQGTYTGKLGYIIYHDGKVWRKENSWESWRHHEGKPYRTWDVNRREYVESVYEGVEPIEFDNVPTEGFVLNKKAGGYSSGWNHRQTYCRVYDPRGWEFEITIPNLLFILENSSSFKGKGLEGEFVYSWDGKDLVLLPTSCHEYQSSNVFTDLQSKKVTAKSLVEGKTYLTSRMKSVVYLGKFNVCASKYDNITSIENQFRNKERKPVFTKKHVFRYVDFSEYQQYEFLTSINIIKSLHLDEIHSEYSNMVDEFTKSYHHSEADHLIVVPFEEDELNFHYSIQCFDFANINNVNDLKNAYHHAINNKDNTYSIYKTPTGYYSRNSPHETNISLEVLKTKYGSLARIYRSGHVERISL